MFVRLVVLCGLLGGYATTTSGGGGPLPVINDRRGFDDSILYDIEWTAERHFVSASRRVVYFSHIGLNSVFHLAAAL